MPNNLRAWLRRELALRQRRFKVTSPDRLRERFVQHQSRTEYRGRLHTIRRRIGSGDRSIALQLRHQMSAHVGRFTVRNGVEGTKYWSASQVVHHLTDPITFAVIEYAIRSERSAMLMVALACCRHYMFAISDIS